MNKPPSLQAALVAGLNLLNDPEVRVPASQAEGLVALRVLFQGLAAGQLVVVDAAAATQTAAPAEITKKERAPRRTKAQLAAARAAANGAAGPTAVASSAATQ